MSKQHENLFLRGDTFFGVCEGLGQDFGIPPLLLRLSFVPLLFLHPMAAVAIYAGLGVLVMITRWLVPDRTSPPHARSSAVVAGQAGLIEQEPEELRLAA